MSAPPDPAGESGPAQRDGGAPEGRAGAAPPTQSGESDKPAPDALHAAVRTRRERQTRRQREGEGSLARDLALIGVLGWTIVGPTLIGLFGGRWLDRRLGTGIFWTGALLTLGLALGCLLAWRRVRAS